MLNSDPHPFQPSEPCQKICYRIPGKVMIAGEYGILFGMHKAFACTINRFLWVQALWYENVPRKSRGITVTSTGFFHTPLHCKWEHLKEQKELCSKAIHQVILHQSSSKIPHSRLHVIIHSDLPASWGVGSSSAIALGCVLATSHVLPATIPEAQQIHDAYQAQHSYQSSLASGYDIQTQHIGGAVWSELPHSPDTTSQIVKAYKASAKHLLYIQQHINFFAQSSDTTPTKHILPSMLKCLISNHKHKYIDTSSLRHITIKDFSETGKHFITTQKQLLHTIQSRASLPQLISTMHQTQIALHATPAFSNILHELHNIFTQTCHGYSRSFTFKPTGAGGGDIILIIGELAQSTLNILTQFGYHHATTCSEHKAEIYPFKDDTPNEAQ